MSPKLLITIALFTICVPITSAQQPLKTVADFEARGVAAQRTGNCEEAVQYYAEAIKLDAKSFVAQANSGNCYLKLGKPQVALSFLQMAATLRPSDPLVHYILGVAYVGTKQSTAPKARNMVARGKR